MGSSPCGDCDYAVIPGVRDKYVPCSVNHNPLWDRKPISHHGLDASASRNFDDTVVVCIRNEYISGIVYGNALGRVQPTSDAGLGTSPTGHLYYTVVK